MESLIATRGGESRISAGLSLTNITHPGMWVVGTVAISFAVLCGPAAWAEDPIGDREWKVSGEAEPINARVVGLIGTRVELFTTDKLRKAFDISKFTEADQAVIREEVQRRAAVMAAIAKARENQPVREFRDWNVGGGVVKARLSSVTGPGDSHAHLVKQEKGNLITPIAKLAEADQAYIRERMPQLLAEKEARKQVIELAKKLGPILVVRQAAKVAPAPSPPPVRHPEKPWVFSGDEYRNWPLGDDAIDARLRYVEGDNIGLERKDGTLRMTTVPSLAEDDQKLVKGIVERARADAQTKRSTPRPANDSPLGPRVETPGSAARHEKYREFRMRTIEAKKNFDAGVDAESCAAIDELLAAGRKEQIVSDDGASALGAVYGTLQTDINGKEPADEASWNALFDRLNRWHELCPKSNGALIALADAWIDYAWLARGGGFANTVRDDQFRLFHDRLKLARSCIEDAIDLADDDVWAYFYQTVIGRGLGDSNKQMLKYVARGMELDPDFEPVYVSMVENLKPKWQGKPGDQEKFADWALKKLGPQRGPKIYALIASSAFAEFGAIDSLDGYQQDVLADGARQRATYLPESHDAYLFSVYLAYLRNDRSAIPPRPSNFNWGARSPKYRETMGVMRHWMESKAHEPRDMRKLRIANEWSVQLVYSTDGRRLAAISSESRTRTHTVSVWDIKEGRLVDRLPSAIGHHEIGMDVGWSRDGRVLFIAATEQLVGWMPGSPDRSYVKTDVPPAKHLRVSADGTRAVTVHSDDVFRVWNADTGEYLREFSMGEPALSYAISADGKTLVLADKNFVFHIWDTDEGKVKQSVEKLDLPMPPVPNQPVSLQGNFTSLRRIHLQNYAFPVVYDLEKNVPVMKLMHNAWRTAQSPSGELFATTKNQLADDSDFDGIILFSTATGQPVVIWEVVSEIANMAFSPDNTVLAAIGRDGCVRMFDVPTDREKK